MLKDFSFFFILIFPTIAAWPPVTDRLNEISVPTLIVLGEEDAGFIRASKIMNERIENSELVVIENAGHNPHEENIEPFNRAFLDFLLRIWYRCHSIDEYVWMAGWENRTKSI